MAVAMRESVGGFIRQTHVSPSRRAREVRVRTFSELPLLQAHFRGRRTCIYVRSHVYLRAWV